MGSGETVHAFYSSNVRNVIHILPAKNKYIELLRTEMLAFEDYLCIQLPVSKYLI